MGDSRRKALRCKGRRRWDTRVVVNGKEYRAGVFDRIEDAEAAVTALRVELSHVTRQQDCEFEKPRRKNGKRLRPIE
jgi:hypothetical protein